MRWNSPYINHFISPDSIVPEQSQGVQAWDRYAYSNNNPVQYTDPSGHCIEDLCIGEFLLLATFVTLAAEEAAPEIETFVAEEGPAIEQESAALAEEAQPVIGQLAAEGGQVLQETVSTVEELGQTIYRNASGTPDSLTPRLTQDITNSLTQGKTPGLSFWNSLDKLNPGKYVSVDTSKLKTLDIIFDDDPEGHVTITTALDKLSDWANTRGSTIIMEQAHKLTQEVWDAAGRVVSIKK